MSQPYVNIYALLLAPPSRPIATLWVTTEHQAELPVYAVASHYPFCPW